MKDLCRIAQTPPAAISRLKIIRRNKNISLASKVKLMRTPILSTFLYACESWTFTAKLERMIQALEMRCCRRRLNISYKDHVTNEEVRSRIQNGNGVHDDLKPWWRNAWPLLKILWHGDYSTGDSERSKVDRKHGEDSSAGDREMSKIEKNTEEEMDRTSKNRQERILEFSWRQQKTGKGRNVLL